MVIPLFLGSPALDHARRLACPLLAVALLSGCDIADKIPRSPEEFRQLTAPFGLPTRELIEETAEGKVYRVTVESRDAASWVRADYAMWETLQHSCPDGERYVTLSTEPEVVLGSVDGGGSSRREWPAGTLFVRIVRCAPKPPYEFEFEPSLAWEDAQGQMIRRLHDAAPGAEAQQVVRPLLDFPGTPKYKQIEEIIGEAIHHRLAYCPAGVVVTHPMIGVFPTAGTSKNGSKPAGYVGFILECVDKPPVEAPSGS